MDIVFDASRVVKGFTPGDDFSYSIIETPEIVGGSTADQSFYDATNTVTTSTGIVNNFSINVAESFLIPGHSYVNNTPSIASISANNVSFVSAGVALIDVVTPVGTRRITRTMTNTATTATAFKQYKTGSLGAHIKAQIDAMISGKTPGQATQKLTTANNYSTTALSATRNASLFTGAMDLSAITLARSDQSNEVFPYMLISPRHVIAASHITTTDTVAWMTNAGVPKYASIVSWARDTNTDIAVGYLSAAITGINPFKFLPSTWANYLASLGDYSSAAQHLPCLEKLYHPDDTDTYTSGVMVTELNQLNSTNAIVLTGNAVSATYRAWTDGTLAARAPDSGSPIMLPINGEAILVSAHWGSSGGTNYAAKSAWIETQMNTLAAAQGDATSYALLRADLSGFTAYPTI